MPYRASPSPPPSECGRGIYLDGAGLGWSGRTFYFLLRYAVFFLLLNCLIVAVCPAHLHVAACCCICHIHRGEGVKEREREGERATPVVRHLFGLLTASFGSLGSLALHTTRTRLVLATHKYYIKPGGVPPFHLPSSRVRARREFEGFPSTDL